MMKITAAAHSAQKKQSGKSLYVAQAIWLAFKKVVKRNVLAATVGRSTGGHTGAGHYARAFDDMGLFIYAGRPGSVIISGRAG